MVISALNPSSQFGKACLLMSCTAPSECPTHGLARALANGRSFEASQGFLAAFL